MLQIHGVFAPKVSLASNNEFTQVFQAIVSALHSLHQLRGV